MGFTVDTMIAADWPQVARIYKDGINTKLATFQTTVPTWESWDAGHIGECRLVARDGEQVVGWAAMSKTSDRCCYAGVVEVSIYVDINRSGQGIGKSLLSTLLAEAEKEGFWTIETRIIRENTASIELHKKCGFEQVGVRKRIGKMDNGNWHDVVLLEYRSQINGMD